MTEQPTTAAPPVAAARERARFFPGQLVVAADFAADQLHVREKLRRHNRMLHGWGVVYGLGVTPGTAPGTVTVGAGFALGPWGDEIWVDPDLTVDLCRVDDQGNAVTTVGGAPGSPWSGEIVVTRAAGQILHLAVAAAESPSAPVRVPSAGCGCDGADGAYEYSRTADGWVVGALTTLPGSYQPMAPPDVNAAFGQSGAVRPAPPLPPEPWLIIADVTMAGPTDVGLIDLYTRRRHATSFGPYYFLPVPSLASLTFLPPAVVGPATVAGQVTLDGPAPAAGATVSLNSASPATLSVPNSVTVSGGTTQAVFQANAVSVGGDFPVVVTAYYGPSSLSTTVDVQSGPGA